MVRIRLKRTGRAHKPSFRVTAVDIRRSRDGRVIEELGYYNPAHRREEWRMNLKLDRIQYWLSMGAQPSDTVKNLLKKSSSEAAKA